MATPIIPIPVLDGSAAAEFMLKADYAEKNSAGEGYSPENHQKMKAILAKAKW